MGKEASVKGETNKELTFGVRDKSVQFHVFFFFPFSVKGQKLMTFKASHVKQ
jgi:hypothetical protein